MSNGTIMYVKFPKIRSFEYICEKMRDDSDSTGKVSYGAKDKLNGRNVAVQLGAQGSVTAQEKEMNLTPENDKLGFGRWVSENRATWASAHGSKVAEQLGWAGKNVLVFGEWAGNAVVREPADAVTRLPETFFFVFGVLVDGDKLFCEPAVIAKFVPTLSHLRVLPWFIKPEDGQVDFRSEASMQCFADRVSDIVEKMEPEDPYIKAEFGISGPAEGLVLTPVVQGGDGSISMEQFRDFTFKAKVSTHWVHRTTRPAVTTVTVPGDVAAFTHKFVTEGRCTQGLTEACDGVASKVGVDAFVAWMEKDVKKESEYERERMDVKWKELSRHVTVAATRWFLKKCS